MQAATRAAGVPTRATVRRWVAAAIAGHGRAVPGSVTVRFVGRAEGEACNQSFRGKAGPTNVLAFPAPPVPAGDEPPELGDLVICLPVVTAEARAQGKRRIDHLAHLVVHGTLHLLGHDHQQADEARRMEALEVRVLRALGRPDPYRTEYVN